MATEAFEGASTTWASTTTTAIDVAQQLAVGWQVGDESTRSRQLVDRALDERLTTTAPPCLRWKALTNREQSP